MRFCLCLHMAIWNSEKWPKMAIFTVFALFLRLFSPVFHEFSRNASLSHLKNDTSQKWLLKKSQKKCSKWNCLTISDPKCNFEIWRVQSLQISVGTQNLGFRGGPKNGQKSVPPILNFSGFWPLFDTPRIVNFTKMQFKVWFCGERWPCDLFQGVVKSRKKPKKRENRPKKSFFQGCKTEKKSRVKPEGDSKMPRTPGKPSKTENLRGKMTPKMSIVGPLFLAAPKSWSKKIGSKKWGWIFKRFSKKSVIFGHFGKNGPKMDPLFSRSANLIWLNVGVPVQTSKKGWKKGVFWDPFGAQNGPLPPKWGPILVMFYR